MEHPVYIEKQWFKFLWIFMPLVTIFSFGAQFFGGVPLASWVAFLILMVNTLVLVFLGSLTIRIDATHLSWSFGWLGWPAWKFALTDIQTGEVVRTRFIDGWGIKSSAQGMLYNVHGYGAIRLTLRNGQTLRLGSQEPQRLLSYITPRLNAR